MSCFECDWRRKKVWSLGVSSTALSRTNEFKGLPVEFWWSNYVADLLNETCCIVRLLYSARPRRSTKNCCLTRLSDWLCTINLQHLSCCFFVELISRFSLYSLKFSFMPYLSPKRLFFYQRLQIKSREWCIVPLLGYRCNRSILLVLYPIVL